MPIRCTICLHPERARIELAIARKISDPAIGKLFHIKHKDSIRRHRINHMPPALWVALTAVGKPNPIDIDELKKSESEGLLQHLIAQRARLYHVAQTALEASDLRAANSAEGRIVENLALTAKLLGEIVQRTQTTHVSLVAHPDYLRLRQRLVEALRPFPEARAAVARAFAEVDGAAPAATGTYDRLRLAAAAARVEGDGRAGP